MQGTDVRVIQGRDCLGLAFETLLEFRVSGEMCGQNLDGDVASEARVAGAIHFAHAAGAERRLNFVGAKLAARGESHWSA